MHQPEQRQGTGGGPSIAAPTDEDQSRYSPRPCPSNPLLRSINDLLGRSYIASVHQMVPFFDLSRDSEAASTNDYLAKKLTFHCLKPEEVLLKKGSPLDRIFVIVSGLLQVTEGRAAC